MKTLFIAMAMTLTTLSMNAHAEDQPRDVAVNVSEAFIPSGFDSSAEAYIILSGIMPNGCYRWKSAEVKHLDSTNHEVKALATVKQGVCPRMLIPFSEQVKLGKLVSGNHVVKIMNGDGTYFEKKFAVE